MAKPTPASEKVLEDIKNLLILQLYKAGSTTNEIGAVLGVSSRTVERVLPGRKVKRKK
jgi:Mn-dependent DtxR family transcriptional regulator